VVEQALETVALMLGTDKSRGYCLEMICADLLAGANLENENPNVLLESVTLDSLFDTVFLHSPLKVVKKNCECNAPPFVV
jgi:hypothetical protein